MLMSNATALRIVRRFLKPSQVAEIRERTVSQVRGFEFLVFINGSLIESQVFCGDRLGMYAHELQACCAQFQETGWMEDSTSVPRSHG